MILQGTKRQKQLEDEAREQGLTPTKDLEVDESELAPEEKGKNHFPWSILIVAGVLITIMAVFLIIILANGGPIK